MLCVNVTDTQIPIQDLCLGGSSKGRGALRQLLRQFQQVLTWRRVPIFRLLGEGGLVDVFRALNAKPEQYTWWSNRGQAWAKNVGWRLDYHLATPGIAAKARREHIYLEQRFSDHAPVIVDYDFKL